MVVQQCQNWGTLDLTLQRSWQLITRLPAARLPGCCSAAVMPCLSGWCPCDAGVSVYWLNQRFREPKHSNRKVQKLSIQFCWWSSGWDSSGGEREPLLAPVRLYGPVCPLHQLGLRGGEAEHGPETPQSEETYVHQVWHAQVPREGRGGHSLILSLRRAGGCLTAARMILSSCPCLWRSGRLMTSSWRQRSSSRRWNVPTLAWTRPLSTRDVIDYKYYLLKNVFNMSRRTFNSY